MSESMNKFMAEFIPDQTRFYNFMNRLYEAALPTAVFSQPVTAGDYTVITASEVTIGLGAGFGGGGGGDSTGDGRDTDQGAGGGGGGGGSAMARPVATISIGPQGVHVEPIVDPTKIAVTLFTVIGAIFVTRRKIRRFQETDQL